MIDNNWFSNSLGGVVLTIFLRIIGTIIVVCIIGIFIINNHPYNNPVIKSPKPIIPELQITGNGVNMDTVYIYKIEDIKYDSK
jgi:uncharacterized alpha/beta hydrolase family protein